MVARSMVLAVALSAPALAHADDDTRVRLARPNDATRVQLSPYVEAGGPSLYYSANGDLRIGRWLAVRAGLAAVSDGQCSECPRQPGPLWVFPAGASFVVGEVHAWETQLGGEYLAGGQRGTGDERFIGFVGTGYRYQARDEGLFFRASAYVLASREVVLPWGGVSVGYAFTL